MINDKMHHPRWSEQPEQIIELLKSYLRMDEAANPALFE
jgi:hypothetical protein